MRVDAAAAYHWRVGDLKLTTRLNLINLFDQRYFESSNTTDPLTRVPRLGIFPGPPLIMLGSIQVTY
jgi:outer membrane receptor protein involved in Fe transport